MIQAEPVLVARCDHPRCNAVRVAGADESIDSFGRWLVSYGWRKVGDDLVTAKWRCFRHAQDGKTT